MYIVLSMLRYLSTIVIALFIALPANGNSAFFMGTGWGNVHYTAGIIGTREELRIVLYSLNKLVEVLDAEKIKITINQNLDCPINGSSPIERPYRWAVSFRNDSLTVTVNTMMFKVDECKAIVYYALTNRKYIEEHQENIILPSSYVTEMGIAIADADVPINLDEYARMADSVTGNKPIYMSKLTDDLRLCCYYHNGLFHMIYADKPVKKSILSETKIEGTELVAIPHFSILSFPSDHWIYSSLTSFFHFNTKTGKVSGEYYIDDVRRMYDCAQFSAISPLEEGNRLILEYESNSYPKTQPLRYVLDKTSGKLSNNLLEMLTLHNCRTIDNDSDYPREPRMKIVPETKKPGIPAWLFLLILAVNGVLLAATSRLRH